MKLRMFCKANNMIIKTKQQPTNGKRSSPQPHIKQSADLKNLQRTQEISHQTNK